MNRTRIRYPRPTKPKTKAGDYVRVCHNAGADDLTTTPAFLSFHEQPVQRITVDGRVSFKGMRNAPRISARSWVRVSSLHP